MERPSSQIEYMFAVEQYLGFEWMDCHMSDVDNIHNQGEAISSGLSFTWINPGPIEAGEHIVPAKLSSDTARTFAALHLIMGDLTFAIDCLKMADEAGIPDSSNLQSKALIFSGVVGYARCFKTGVRSITLDPKILIHRGAPFDENIHSYMIALRDKHIAHSVNDFEDCEAIAIMIGKPGSGWRDGSGVGVVMKQTIGMSRILLQQAIQHIEALKQFIEADLSVQRNAVYVEFQENLAKTGKWEMAPIVKFPDRAKISERRK